LPSFDTVHVEGIRNISGEDVELADQLGFSIKLLGIVSMTEDGKTLQRVHPALIPLNTALGGTHGVTNGLFTLGDFVGGVFSQGPGAGREATASAVVSDLVDISLENTTDCFGVAVNTMKEMQTISMNERVGQYYLRFDNEKDRAAVVKELKQINVTIEQHNKINVSNCCVVTGEVLESEIMSIVTGNEGSIKSMIRVEGPW